MAIKVKAIVMACSSGTFNGNFWGRVTVINQRDDDEKIDAHGILPIEIDVYPKAVESLKPYLNVLPICAELSLEIVQMKNANKANKGGTKVLNIKPFPHTVGMFPILVDEIFAAADKAQPPVPVSGFTPPASSPAAPAPGMVIKN